MDKGVYSSTTEPRIKTNIRPFFVQLLICSGVWTSYFLVGLCMGAPTVLIPQIRKEGNSDSTISEEMESWISSVIGYGGIPWVFILPALTKVIGRKIPFIILCINTFAAFILFYLSTNSTHLLISQIMQGMGQTFSNSILPVILAEYTSPKYRGLFLTIKSASFYWGMWASNAIGTFFYWKYIAAFSFICSCYTLTVFFWPESPHWLACKGRFDECAAAYRLIHGTDEESEKELKDLIGSQKMYLSKKNDSKEPSIKKVWNACLSTIKCKQFYKPISLCILMTLLYHLSGKLVYSIYAIKIIKKMTESESVAYKGMLILDGVTLLGMYIGCALTKFVKRRKLLLGSSAVGVFFLFALSLYLYLVSLNVVVENSILSLFLLVSFSVTISCGPMILSSSIYGELVPLRFKSSSMFTMGLSTNIIVSTVLKVSPHIFTLIGIHGAFLFYGISSSICLLILYKYLPETKDKTIQEIADYFADTPKNTEESKELIAIKKIDV